MNLPAVVSFEQAVRDRAAAEIRSGSCPVLSTVYMPEFGIMRGQTRIARDCLANPSSCKIEK